MSWSCLVTSYSCKQGSMETKPVIFQSAVFQYQGVRALGNFEAAARKRSPALLTVGTRWGYFMRLTGRPGESSKQRIETKGKFKRWSIIFLFLLNNLCQNVLDFLHFFIGSWCYINNHCQFIVLPIALRPLCSAADPLICSFAFCAFSYPQSTAVQRPMILLLT